MALINIYIYIYIYMYVYLNSLIVRNGEERKTDFIIDKNKHNKNYEDMKLNYIILRPWS